MERTTPPSELPSVGRSIETPDPVPLPPAKGRTDHAPSPMALDSGPIKKVVLWSLCLVAVSYIAMMSAFVHGHWGHLDALQAWPFVALLGIHVVGWFAVLLRYFGATWKVSLTSAESG